MGERNVFAMQTTKFDTLIREIGIEMWYYPTLRAGQNAFNALHRVYPEIANEHIRGVWNLDPFYNDNRLNAFYAACWELLTS